MWWLFTLTYNVVVVVVQSLQEKEEDNMDDIKHVTEILGLDKVYLYPSILQLVMAEGVFTEGNARDEIMSNLDKKFEIFLQDT